MSIQLTTLPNGVRVITDTVNSVDSVALGVWCDVGARHESKEHNGIAHMVEHMLFKGTPTRTSLDIAEKIDNVGGQMNAFTSREMTAYHVHILKDYTELAIDILSDMVLNSTMPDKEVERERGVILQEIGMNKDTPDDYIFDMYQMGAYQDQTLGACILGQDEIIKSMSRDTLQGFVEDFYTADRLVISAAGHIEHDVFVAMVEKRFNQLSAVNDSKPVSANYTGGENLLEKELEQAHVILGFQGVSRHDDSAMAQAALATILGGGMSSRLFQEIREKRGLVYSVFSFQQCFQDDGLFAIYAGTGGDKLPELFEVLYTELKSICDFQDTQALDRAKAQMKSHILMSRESMLKRANLQAKRLIHFTDVLDIQDKISRIDALTLSDISGVARNNFTKKPTLAALGPIEQLPSCDIVEKNLAL
jgi:predicted Zn-dependent peptidase